MNAVDYLVLAVVGVIIALVLRYIHKARKRGIKCIGCPESVKCAGRCAGCSGNCCGNNTHADHAPTPHE